VSLDNRRHILEAFRIMGLGGLGEVSADRLIDAALSLRDRALVLVMLGSGIRVSEVQGLDCSDLVEVDGEPVLWVRQGKGAKDRLVPITEEVSEAIHLYLTKTGGQFGDSGPMFLAEDRGAKTRENQRLSTFGIRCVLKRRVNFAAIAKRITPHALRRTFGMEFQRNSADLNKTVKVLGHATLVPTLRYTAHLELAELRIVLPRWIRRDGNWYNKIKFGRIPLGHWTEILPFWIPFNTPSFLYVTIYDPIVPSLLTETSIVNEPYTSPMLDLPVPPLAKTSFGVAMTFSVPNSIISARQI